MSNRFLSIWTLNWPRSHAESINQHFKVLALLSRCKAAATIAPLLETAGPTDTLGLGYKHHLSETKKDRLPLKLLVG